MIQIEEHPFLTRHGRDLVCEVPITYSQAALGATVDVPTLKGAQPLEIPKGTQSDATIKMRGMGMPEVRGRGIGDLIVQIHIEVPRKLSARSEELLRQLADEEHTSVTPKRTSFFDRLKDYFQPRETPEESA